MTPRQAAIHAGEKRYHGKPCGNCRGTERWAGNSNCIACHRVVSRAYSASMSGLKYSRKLLRNRRYAGLRRMAARNRRTQEALNG